MSEIANVEACPSFAEMIPKKNILLRECLLFSNQKTTFFSPDPVCPFRSFEKLGIIAQQREQTNCSVKLTLDILGNFSFKTL